MISEIGAHSSDGRPLLQVETPQEWRGWLERNHDGSGGVWLVSWKQAMGKPSVPYGDAVDEALCFGWIDSRVNTLDDEVEELVIPPDLAAENRMANHPAGRDAGPERKPD